MDSDTSDFIDCYKILQCERNATKDEIKKSYQRLARAFHPDKIHGTVENQSFVILQKAWNILRDADLRKQHDAELCCKEHNNSLIYEVIKLTDMEYSASKCVYTYTCRCGGLYTAYSTDITCPEIIVDCEECSFSILIKCVNYCKVENETDVR